MNSNYTDFGHKVSGARKDLYTVDSSQLQSESLFELLQSADKSKIWEKPEIGHKDRYMDYLIHEFYSCIRRRPNSDKKEDAENFILELSLIKELVEKAETAIDLKELFGNILSLRDSNGFPVFDQNLLFSRRPKYQRWSRLEMDKKCFGIPKEKIPEFKAKQEIKVFSPDESWGIDRENNRLVKKEFGGYYYFYCRSFKIPEKIDPELLMIIEGNTVLKVNATMEEYNRLVNLRTEQIKKELEQKKKRRTSPRIKYPHLSNIVHSGSDYRQNHNVTVDDIQEKFNFFGGQFGSWVRDNERIEVVNLAYDAFSDLACALNLDPESVSFNSTLSIAFGARGTGNQKAHYELDHRIINLTRLKGAGSLAHEWFHALDHYIAILSENPRSLGSQCLNQIDTLKELVLKVSDYDTQYRKDSLALDVFEHRRKPYWSSVPEMLARAFNCYIIDKLKEKGIRNDYLAFEFDISDSENSLNENPKGSEREELNRLFDKLFNQLREEEILK